MFYDLKIINPFPKDKFRLFKNGREFSKHIMSNFSFSYIFFKRPVLHTHKNQGLFEKELSCCLENGTEVLINLIFSLGCAEGLWQCDDGSCIPDRMRCDGVPQCEDSSDELRCPGWFLELIVIKFNSLPNDKTKTSPNSKHKQTTK